MCEAWARVLRGDPAVAASSAREVVALAAKHGYPQYLAGARIMAGWAGAVQDQPVDVSEMRLALAQRDATGAQNQRHFFLGLAADAARRAGDMASAVADVEQALEECRTTGDRYFEAELHRLRGELLLAGAPGAEGDATACFERARLVARAQGAALFEGPASEGLRRSALGSDFSSSPGLEPER